MACVVVEALLCAKICCSLEKRSSLRRPAHMHRALGSVPCRARANLIFWSCEFKKTISEVQSCLSPSPSLSDVGICLNTAVFHTSFIWAGAEGVMSCWMHAKGLLHPNIALKTSSCKASSL